MLNEDNVSCLRGERRLITALSFTVQRGKLLAVTGENGSGKPSSPRSVEARWMSQPGMLAALRGIIRRDILLALRRRSDVMTTVLFFITVASLFPLGHRT
jgi:ABC-type molybdenum transport system ATPase subunit/photorepair protein PhrA